MTEPASLIVGIDPGVNTGVAVWDRVSQKLTIVESHPIHVAMRMVEQMHRFGSLHSVRFEDARLRRWFGKMDKEQAKYGAAVREGAGSVKRDAGIWADFLGDLGVPYMSIKPSAGATKWTAERFTRVTGWTGRTNEHGRDAAVLVIGTH